MVRRRGPGDRHRACHRWPRLVGISPGPARTRLARAFTMALVVAVARGRDGHADLHPDGDIWDRLGVLRRNWRRDWIVRGPRRGERARDDLLHRDDLRVAEADPSMAQFLGRTELLRSWVDGWVPAARCHRPVLGARTGRRAAPRIDHGAVSLVAQ